MERTIILDKRNEISIIFYSGNNKQEVTDFFKDKPYGKFLKVINGELHYKQREYYRYEETIIKPNNYIYFDYDEDNWWEHNHVSIEEFRKYFIQIKEQAN